ncbi:MAG: hypothetical protein Q9212_004276 [Teloschistes hypoglaucus]
MGRKPNQLVLEYFDRGARLTDNSNRYEQRCKACGENFPKGRTESLVIHIELKCPAIRRENPTPTRLQTQAYSTPPSTADGEGSVQGSIGHVDNNNDSTGLHTLLPVSTRRSLTGLEALAEASRQLTRPVTQDAELPIPSHYIDPHLENAHSDLDNGPRTDDHYHAYYAAATEAPGPTSHLTLPKLSAGFNDSRDSATLSKIAASASNLEAMMPQDQTTQRVDEPWNSSQESAFQPEAASELQMGRLGNIRLAAMPATDQPQAPGSDSSSNSPALQQDSSHANRSRNPSRALAKSQGRNQKIRGKFTDSRRQEVQNIRKKGACIRCRMLRKTRRKSVQGLCLRPQRPSVEA